MFHIFVQNNTKMTRRQAVVTSFMLGALLTGGSYQAFRHNAPADVIIANKENISLHVKAYAICWNSVLANWALRDSVYIPIDSLEQVSQEICGAKIEEIINE